MAIELVDHIDGVLLLEGVFAGVSALSQQAEHALRLLPGPVQAGQPRGARAPRPDKPVEEAFAAGVADHVGGAVGGLAQLLAVAGGLQLTHHRELQGQGFVIRHEQLPGQIGGGVIQHQHQLVELAGQLLERRGHQQLKQGAGEIVVEGGSLDGGRHQRFHQATLALLPLGFGPGPLPQEGEAQRVGQFHAGAAILLLPRGLPVGDHQPGPIAVLFRRIQPVAPSLAKQQLPLQAQHPLPVTVQPGVESGQGSGGGDGRVEVKLHQPQVSHPRSQTGEGGGELRVGGKHPLHQGHDGVLDGDGIGGVLTDQQGGQPHLLCRSRAAVPPIQELQQVAQRAHPHRLGEGQARKVAHGAQADHHRAATAALPPLPAAGGHQHHRARSVGAGVETQAMATAELAGHEVAVDQGFGRGDRIVLVVPHQQRLVDVAQVHGVAGHPQGARGGGGIGLTGARPLPRRRRAREREDVASLQRVTLREPAHQGLSAGGP